MEEDIKLIGKGRVVKIDSNFGAGKEKKTWSFDGKGILRRIAVEPVKI